ncbi:MAG: hypothetical protein FWH53_10340 [Leptospirales bacterium]|nr:hypothetical protein [Leptospirales bacterium]
MNIIKKIIICMIASSVILSCSKDNAIQFCEGVDNDGNGVRCGKKFTTGDLTGVINSAKPFEAESLTLKIIHIEKNSEIVDKTINLKVERDKNKANAALPFYNSGNYKVELFKEDDLLAEGSVEIIDTL